MNKGEMRERERERERKRCQKVNMRMRRGEVLPAIFVLLPPLPLAPGFLPF